VYEKWGRKGINKLAKGNDHHQQKVDWVRPYSRSTEKNPEKGLPALGHGVGTRNHNKKVPVLAGGGCKPLEGYEARENCFLSSQRSGPTGGVCDHTGKKRISEKKQPR